MSQPEFGLLVDSRREVVSRWENGQPPQGRTWSLIQLLLRLDERDLLKSGSDLKAIDASVIQASYLAGFIDGEGTITANNRRIFNGEKLAVHYRLLLPNTNLEILEKLQTVWGGRLSRYGKRRKPTHRQVYTLYWGGPSCVPVLKAILPYLVVKKQQAGLVLELAKLGYTYETGYRSVRPEYIPRRQEIITELAKLNHRGIPQEAMK